MQEFDLIVIGGGPAGYTAAIRASQLGLKVLCVEKRKTLGGTCLNEGCIPSKALLNMSHKYEESRIALEDYGISTKVSLNLSKMLSKKDQIVGDLCKGIDGLFAKNKIIRMVGKAKIIDKNSVEIKSGDKTEIIQTKNIIIATGSKVSTIPGIEIDGKNIISSTEALSISKIPKNLIIIGGGYIGLELGSVWRRLGTNVTVIEYENRIVPAIDTEIGEKFYQLLKKQGINFKLGQKLISAVVQSTNTRVVLEHRDTKNQEEITADIVLISTGRTAYTDDLGLKNVGIILDDKARIPVNKKYQTIVNNIYAVGDVIEGPMLAHKGEEEAIAAVENICGQSGHVNYNVIPSVIYTDPELASIGKTEKELKDSGIEYNIGKFPFLANSRARSTGSIDGFVKILADKKTDKVLGAHILGPNAGILIAEIAIAMEFGASSEDIARTCHAHPTLSEAVKEASLAVAKRTINF